MTDASTKASESSKLKFKMTNSKLPVKKATNENLLKVSEQKLKPILDREQLKHINYVTPLRKNIKNYNKVASDQNEPVFRVSVHSSNLPKRKKNDRRNNLSCANDNISNVANDSDLANDANNKSDMNSKKYFKYLQIKDAYTSKSPQKYHRRFNSSFAGTQSKNQERRGTEIQKNHSYLHNSMLGDEHFYSRDLSYNKENNDLTNITAMLNQNNNLKFDDNSVDMANDNILVNKLTEESVKNDAFENGKAYYKEKNYLEAIKCFKEALNSGYKLIENLYLTGVCYLWLGEYENAIKEFGNLLDKQAFHYKNIFLLISIAYKKSNNGVMAIRMLSKAILKYPKYYDAYIYRGKLYIKDKKWEKALFDFKTAIQINPNKGLGYVGQGDCLRMMGEYDEAVSLYTHAMSKEKYLVNVALLKRAIAYIELKKFDDAMDDLETLLANDAAHSEAYYFKGFILQRKSNASISALKSHSKIPEENCNDAILCFEQAIKHNSSKKAVIKSLYEIAKIKIENKDFYEAYYTLHRADLMKLDPKILSKFKLFTEGVIYMMKRKHAEGIDSLTNVLKKQTISDFLKPLAYNYRAYGYYCVGKIRKSLADYIELQNITKLDKSSQYNKYLCEGILYVEQENYETAFAYFDKANKIYRNKMETYFYRACLHIYIYRKSNPKLDIKKLQSTLNNSLRELEKALELNDNCSNLLYILALVLYCLGRLKEALKNIEKAIEKAEENYAKYYNLRGLIQASMKNYQNAISDFTITINLEKNFHNAYLERGKCYFSYGDIKLAFLDIQKYISIMPNDPNIHLWAGNLLFNTGAYEDAAKAYSNSETMLKSEKLLLLRSKCYIALKELNSALSDLHRLVELTNNGAAAVYDRDCLMSLKVATTTKNGGEFDKSNVLQALQKLNKLIGVKSYGNIFKQHDYYFYKAIMHFYLDEYHEALNNLDLAWEHKEKMKQDVLLLKKQGRANSSQEIGDENMIKILEDFCSDNESEEMFNEDGTNTSFTSPEYLFNKSLVLLIDKQYEDALETLGNLLEMLSGESRVKVEYLYNLVRSEITGSEVELADSSAASDEEMRCYVFQTENRLCSIFSPIILTLKNQRIETSFSFCLPTIDPPSMAPSIVFETIDEITVMTVENRPEAPWIRRTQGGVVFTENFLDREEREIENLNEMILANNLKEEDIYASLEKVSEEREEIKNSKEDLLNEAMIIENDFNTSNRKAEAEDTTILSAVPIVADRMKRSKTGAI